MYIFYFKYIYGFSLVRARGKVGVRTSLNKHKPHAEKSCAPRADKKEESEAVISGCLREYWDWIMCSESKIQFFFCGEMEMRVSYSWSLWNNTGHL